MASRRRRPDRRTRGHRRRVVRRRPRLGAPTMDFSVIELDDETAAFADDVHRWLDEQVTDEMIDAEWTSGDGHDVAFHRALGAQGWASPPRPARRGAPGRTGPQARTRPLGRPRR